MAIGIRTAEWHAHGEIRFALMHADDGDQEIGALRSNAEFMAYLTEAKNRPDTQPRYTLEQVREMDGLPPSSSQSSGQSG